MPNRIVAYEWCGELTYAEISLSDLVWCYCQDNGLEYPPTVDMTLARSLKAYRDMHWEHGEIHLDTSEFDTELLAVWCGVHIPTYNEYSNNTKHENMMLFEALDMQSSGLLELVDGQVHIHPSTSLESIVTRLEAIA